MENSLCSRIQSFQINLQSISSFRKAWKSEAANKLAEVEIKKSVCRPHRWKHFQQRKCEQKLGQGLISACSEVGTKQVPKRVTLSNLVTLFGPFFHIYKRK